MITELGLDCGDVCLKEVIQIPEDMNCEQLFEKVSEMSPELIEKTLKGIVSNTIKPTPQCEEGVCMAGKLTKEETEIDWNKTAEEIHNLVRGIYKFPGAYFMHNGKIIKVLETKVDHTCALAAGELGKAAKEGVPVGCSRGTVILTKVKPEGKGEMSARDWYNGIKNR